VVGFEVVLGALLTALDGGVITSIHGCGEQGHRLFGEVAAVVGDPLWWVSIKTAPTSLITAAALGKIPTTRLRRLISLLRRSSGLVDQILRQWALGRR
jgi:hypothetical protein